jgi:hypothetical protein
VIKEDSILVENFTYLFTLLINFLVVSMKVILYLIGFLFVVYLVVSISTRAFYRTKSKLKNKGGKNV